MSSERLEKIFPNLRRSSYRITSDPTETYNCIAWAAGNTKRWYEPTPDPGCYWPANVAREYTLEAYTQVYTDCGYVVCHSDEPEPGYEKVAIYVDSYGLPSHAARLTSSGVWTSKLGELEDIEHDTLKALENSDYGVVARILKRNLLGKGTSE